MKNYTTLRILDIRQETADTRSFVLQEVSAHKMIYQPGQFLTLVFPGKINEERRSYSISSAQVLNESLTITVKRIDNGAYSRYLFDSCEIGSSVYTIGASGFFTLPDPSESGLYESIVFFAAGSGITPIIPLIKTILYTRPLMRILLVYSNRSVESTIFYKELTNLQSKFAERLSIDFLFSNSKNLLHARLSKAKVAEYLKMDWLGKKADTLFYLCGPHSFMQMIWITLLTEGVPAENIRKEIFDTHKPLVRMRPPDEEPHTVRITYRGKNYRFMSQYPQTILSTAKAQGIVLPYSCEAGKCGTCASTCVQGKVWMYYNEVLMDKELASGRILTCTGYPIEGDVVLVFPEA
jgi:ferredoxin-NADP reductase